MNEHGIRIIAGLRSRDEVHDGSETTTSMGDTTPPTSSTENGPSTSTEHVADRHSTEQVVQRLMTVPPRRPPPARISTLPTLSEPVLPDPVPSANTTRRSRVVGLVSPRLPRIPVPKVRKPTYLLHIFTFKKRAKPKKAKRRSRKVFWVILSLASFCTTAIIYIGLAFSLQTFPSFMHIIFIGTLGCEFGLLVRSLLVLASHRAKLQSLKQTEDGPPPGTIIHGARNWDDSSDRASVGTAEVHFDLEEIGNREALKPVPPAYGMYRGSIRIADGDLSWVRASEVGQHPPRIDEVEETQSQEGVVRPPSYASRAASRQAQTTDI